MIECQDHKRQQLENNLAIRLSAMTNVATDRQTYGQTNYALMHNATLTEGSKTTLIQYVNCK